MRFAKFPKYGDLPVMSLEDVGLAIGVTDRTVGKVVKRYTQGLSAE